MISFSFSFFFLCCIIVIPLNLAWIVVMDLAWDIYNCSSVHYTDNETSLTRPDAIW